MDEYMTSIDEETGLKRIERAICEDLGWTIIASYDDDRVALQQYSPAGEDFSFVAETDRFCESIIDYYNSFDPDEHAALWAKAKYEGRDDSIPGIRELIKDADDIQDMIERLAHELTSNMW